MNKEQIWEVLECCLLASDGADTNYLLEEGFNPKLSNVGIKLYSYLKSKRVEK